LTAQDWDYEEDVAIEKEAQEQLAAMLQWSARYQFGKDLKSRRQGLNTRLLEMIRIIRKLNLK